MSTYSGCHANSDLRSLIISPFGSSDDYSQTPIVESFTTHTNVTSNNSNNIENSDGTTCQSGIRNKILKQKASISRNNTQKKTKSAKSNASSKITRKEEQKSSSTSTPKSPAAFGKDITTNTQSLSHSKHLKLKKHGRWDFVEGQKIRKYTASKMDIWIDTKNTEKWYQSIQGFDDASELYYWLNFGTGLCLMTQYGSTRKFSLSQSKCMKDDRVCTVLSDDISFANTVTTSGHQLKIEFVIINYEIIHTQTWKTLYGVIELNHGKYKHQLIELLTCQQIYEKYGIEEKDLPEATRESEQFKKTIKMDKNEKLTYEALMGMNTKYKFASKKKGIYDTDFIQETKVIQKYLTKWRIKAIDEQKVIEIQDLVPLLFINSQRGDHRTDWAYFVRIMPFGYDVAMVFRFKNDRFEFKRVLLDVEEVKSVHNLLGRQNIHEIEQEFEVPTSHYEELLAQRPRSGQMNKTRACLEFDQELKEKEVVNDVDGVKQRLEEVQQELKNKERIIGKLLDERKERQVMQEQQNENERRKSVCLMIPVERKNDEDEHKMEQKAKKNQRKKLKQKLKDIEKLEIKQKAGDELLPQQIEKINKKREYEAKLKSLRNGNAGVADAGIAGSNSDKARIIINKFKSMEKELMHKNRENDELKAVNKKLNASRHLILSQNECLKQRLERYQENDDGNEMRKNSVMHELQSELLSENAYLRQKLEQFEYQHQTMVNDGEILRKQNEKLRKENERLRANYNVKMERKLMEKQQIIENLRFENDAYQVLGDKVLKENTENMKRNKL